MTNTLQAVTNAIADAGSQSFFAQYTSEIVVAVITATILVDSRVSP